VTSLECLANLGDAATVASAASCLGPLQSATINTPIEQLLACLGSACGATCGLAAADGGIDASPPGDASTMDVVVTGAPDVVTDAPCPICTGGVCCQQTELTSTMDPPIAFWLDGTTLFWTANSPTAGEILSFTVPPGTSTGLFTLLSTPSHTYGALGGSATNLFFVDQTAGQIMTMPQAIGAVSVVATGASAGVAVQSAADGGTGATVYFGGPLAVSWVPFPVVGPPTAAINLVATQVALDATNVYAVGQNSAGECPLGNGSASASTFSTGPLSHGNGIFADAGGDVWVVDMGASDAGIPSTNGAIYRCSAATGACGGGPFVSGRSNPYAVVADGTYVYWTEAYPGGGIMRCPVSGCLPGGPEAIAHGFETPTALAQDAARIYWADVNNISMLVK
jgi:hypothetical protein